MNLNPGCTSILCQWSWHLIRIASSESAVNFVPRGNTLQRGVCSVLWAFPMNWHIKISALLKINALWLDKCRIFIISNYIANNRHRMRNYICSNVYAIFPAIHTRTLKNARFFYIVFYWHIQFLSYIWYLPQCFMSGFMTMKKIRLAHNNMNIDRPVSMFLFVRYWIAWTKPSLYQCVCNIWQTILEGYIHCHNNETSYLKGANEFILYLSNVSISAFRLSAILQAVWSID